MTRLANPGANVGNRDRELEFEKLKQFPAVTTIQVLFLKLGEDMSKEKLPYYYCAHATIFKLGTWSLFMFDFSTSFFSSSYYSDSFIEGVKSFR